MWVLRWIVVVCYSIPPPKYQATVGSSSHCKTVFDGQVYSRDALMVDRSGDWADNGQTVKGCSCR